MIYNEKDELLNNNKLDIHYKNNMDFFKNNFINNNICNNNFNYFNNQYLINDNDTKEKIENNNYSLELKYNITNLKINNKIKKEKTSTNKKKNKFKVTRKISKYRGVTRNKKKWQVYIWKNKKNNYLGSYSSEKFAAKIYDVMAIKQKGFKAKTNFKYSIMQINAISQINIDINNIHDIASKRLFDI